MTPPISVAPLLERFFTQRLMQQRQASAHTISSYRDTFRQFLVFVQQRAHTPPSRLTFEQIDAPLIAAFLNDVEKRGVSVRTRNLRLTAFHSFFPYAAFELPTHAAQIQRVLAIPSKRFTRTLVQFLTQAEVEPCSPRRINAPGAAGGITPFSSSPSRQDSACPRSPALLARTSSSAWALTSASSAKGARNGAPRSPDPHGPC
jgi:hypothetical protein